MADDKQSERLSKTFLDRCDLKDEAMARDGLNSYDKGTAYSPFITSDDRFGGPDMLVMEGEYDQMPGPSEVVIELPLLAQIYEKNDRDFSGLFEEVPELKERLDEILENSRECGPMLLGSVAKPLDPFG